MLSIMKEQEEDESTTTISTIDHLNIDIWTDKIFPFVGDYQFRFVAGVHPTFYQAYSITFPKKQTYYNLSTLDHAKLCYEEIHNQYRQSMLCAYAAKHGLLNVLQYLRGIGCPWNVWTCTYAAEKGHFKILQWAHTKGCPWNELTFAYAARGGHLDVLKWLRDENCPWSGSTNT
jgi:hypothetical protein